MASALVTKCEINTMKPLACVSSLLLLTTLGACISDPKVVEEDFGKSVRQMVNGQIAEPAVASNPELEGPLLIDGVAASESVGGYREAAKRPTKREGISFSVFE